MHPLKLVVAACSVLLASSHSYSEPVALPLDGEGLEPPLLRDFVEICSGAMVSYQQSQAMALERGWVDANSDAERAGSPEIDQAEEDPSLEGAFLSPVEQLSENSGIGRMEIRTYEYPHMNGRDCRVQISNADLDFSLAGLDQVDEFEGEFLQPGDDKSVFGDVSDFGDWSFAMGSRSVVIVSASKVERNFVGLSMTSYVLLPDGAHHE